MTNPNSDPPRTSWFALQPDAPPNRAIGWLRTTAGAVAILLLVQIATGILLTNFYVPYPGVAHTTVSYIEKMAAGGSWIRSLHHYGSQWLAVSLSLHVAQMIWLEGYLRRPIGWWVSIVLLGLVMAEGATGYSLPWDIRAFYATRITEGLVAGLPLVGQLLRRWVIGGDSISPVTITRFYSAHILTVPLLIIIVIAIRAVRFRDRVIAMKSRLTAEDWFGTQFRRNMITAGLVFVLIGLYAARNIAPLGPPADAADPTYLPRPGPQFLWLFEILRLLPGKLASVTATAFPGLVLLALASLPLYARLQIKRDSWKTGFRRIAPLVYSAVLILVAGLTIAAKLQDRNNPEVRTQLARQQADENDFRSKPFEPLNLDNSETAVDQSASPSPSSSPVATKQGGPPSAYMTNCATCHGAAGEGSALFPRLIGVSQKPRRTVDDIVALVNDPKQYGLRPPMKSYKDILSEQDKRDIAEWIEGLKRKR